MIFKELFTKKSIHSLLIFQEEKNKNKIYLMLLQGPMTAYKMSTLLLL